MKYPKEMIVHLKSGDTIPIKFFKVIYLPTKDLFQATIQMTAELVESELKKDTIEFITEEKDF